MEKSRNWVSSTLYNLKTKGLLKKIEDKNGTYQKV